MSKTSSPDAITMSTGTDYFITSETIESSQDRLVLVKFSYIMLNLCFGQICTFQPVLHSSGYKCMYGESGHWMPWVGDLNVNELWTDRCRSY